ncbi:hypothetical protein HZA71_01605 [Candidatus Falkowbacteria bacterium]|nr:hypothetical protein [Candidatus Falkowbacteria bacterium]
MYTEIMEENLMRRPFGRALFRQWWRQIRYFLGLDSFADELRRRARKEIKFFLSVCNGQHLSIHNSTAKVAFFKGMILAVTEEHDDYYIADYFGSVAVYDCEEPTFYPEYYLIIKIPKLSVHKGLHRNDLKVISDAEVKRPDQRITAQCRSLSDTQPILSKEEISAIRARGVL